MVKDKKFVKEGEIFSGQSGKSLIELVVVLTIIVIIATFAVAQYRNSQPQFLRQNIARELKISFERARFDSVKRRTSSSSLQSKVVVNQTWFSLSTDLNNNGTIDTNDAEVTNFASDGIMITGQSMSFPVTLTYDERGNVVAKGSDGALVNPVFYVCNGSCTPTTANSSNANIVLVSPTGTVNLLKGNATLPSFIAPTISSVSGDTGINSLVAVLPVASASATPTSTTTATPTITPTATTTATPTATATATPTATATATPTATATATASPTPTNTSTPTPTPTPVYCTTNQKPSLTGCTCKYPMTIHTNGKCY